MHVSPNAPVRRVAVKTSLRYYVPFAVAFVFSAVIATTLWTVIGTAFGAGNSWQAAVAVALLTVFAALEHTKLRRSLVLRQTPNGLPRHLGDIVGAAAWGLDTGSMLSTYRISFATWGTIVLCVAGFGGPQLGVAYGLGFVVPLGVNVYVTAAGAPGRGANDLVGRINQNKVYLRHASVVLMLFTAGMVALGA